MKATSPRLLKTEDRYKTKPTNTPDKHLHISMLQAVVHHPHQVFQDLQGMHLGLSSKVPQSYLFVVH